MLTLRESSPDKINTIRLAVLKKLRKIHSFTETLTRLSGHILQYLSKNIIHKQDLLLTKNKIDKVIIFIIEIFRIFVNFTKTTVDSTGSLYRYVIGLVGPYVPVRTAHATTAGTGTWYGVPA